MKFRYFNIGFQVIVIVFALIVTSRAKASPPTSAETSPTTHSSRANEQNALDQSITALVAEYKAAQVKDSKTEMRVDCDYFKQNPTTDLSEASVLPVLETGGGSDIKLESYVRWQLLSITPKRFDDVYWPRLLTIYKRTPVLLTRPGITPASRMTMINWSRGHTQSEIDGIDDKLADDMGKFNAFNSPILRFRSELVRKMPLHFECVAATFDDLMSRTTAGVDDWSNKEFLQTLDTMTRDWLATKPPTEQIDSIARYVAKLAAGRGPEFFDKLVWKSEASRLDWKTKSQTIDHDGILQKLQKDLAAAVAAKH